MRMRHSVVIAIFVAFFTFFPKPGEAFDVTGGRVWENRVGPGIFFSLGFNGCAKDYCHYVWDTGPSAGTTVGFFWRVIPNLVIFGDFHFGHISVDASHYPYFRDWRIVDDEGFVFQTTGGAEFHLPLANWVAVHSGLGLGFAYFGVWGDDLSQPGNRRFHYSYRGFDFQMRFGADFYPFVRVKNLGIGPILNVGIPAWITACYDHEWDNFHGCEDPDKLNQAMRINRGDSPIIIYFGIAMKYGFDTHRRRRR